MKNFKIKSVFPFVTQCHLALKVHVQYIYLRLYFFLIFHRYGRNRKMFLEEWRSGVKGLLRDSGTVELERTLDENLYLDGDRSHLLNCSHTCLLPTLYPVIPNRPLFFLFLLNLPNCMVISYSTFLVNLLEIFSAVLLGWVLLVVITINYYFLFFSLKKILYSPPVYELWKLFVILFFIAKNKLKKAEPCSGFPFALPLYS